MPFTTPIELVVPSKEGDEWVTREALNFWSVKKQKHYVVPAKFKTDLASHWLVRGSINGPAVLHDWLYRFGVKFKQIKTQQEADDVFYEAMRDTGVSPPVAYAAYWAVKMFGYFSFNRYVP
jgi:hypothetical protein